VPVICKLPQKIASTDWF